MPATVAGPRQVGLPGVLAELGVKGSIFRRRYDRPEADPAGRGTPVPVGRADHAHAHPQVPPIAAAAKYVHALEGGPQAPAAGRNRHSPTAPAG